MEVCQDDVHNKVKIKKKNPTLPLKENPQFFLIAIRYNSKIIFCIIVNQVVRVVAIFLGEGSGAYGRLRLFFFCSNERSSVLSDHELIMLIISITLLVVAVVDITKDKK